MDQKEAEKIVLQVFEKESKRSTLSFKELALALSLEKKPKMAKRYLNQMVENGLLRWHHADTIYYELLSKKD